MADRMLHLLFFFFLFLIGSYYVISIIRATKEADHTHTDIQLGSLCVKAVLFVSNVINSPLTVNNTSMMY